MVFRITSHYITSHFFFHLMPKSFLQASNTKIQPHHRMNCTRQSSLTLTLHSAERQMVQWMYIIHPLCTNIPSKSHIVPPGSSIYLKIVLKVHYTDFLTGIPQGCSLGPSLFLFFLSEMRYLKNVVCSA